MTSRYQDSRSQQQLEQPAQTQQGPLHQQQQQQQQQRSSSLSGPSDSRPRKRLPAALTRKLRNFCDMLTLGSK